MDDRPGGGQGVLLTDGSARRLELASLLGDAAMDAAVAAMATAIARRLSVRRRPRKRRAEQGIGALTSMPYTYRSDEIDLDRTIEVLAERPVPDDTDVVVRERTGNRRSVVLIVDVSGSMRGEKVRIAAATVAALCADLTGLHDQLGVVAFWSDAALIKRLTDSTTATRLLDTLLRIPARGLTNVGFGLDVAQTELRRSAAPQRTAILLSDAVHNAGPDPRILAHRFPELHVLLETDGEHDHQLGRDLARLGRGTVTPIRTHREVAPALNRILDRQRRAARG
ncbi:vWA domain-containing protein [Pseudonocardia sp. GCM10023141]|uniref:vWA domain-containing protein n=1 Tax=Pseudonocardia sp. GCM10023141 TaxID=3252653 RepID=UPI003617E1EC